MIVDQLFENKKLNEHDGEDCNLCNGTGEGMFDGESCPKCDGTGMVHSHHDDDDFDVPDDDYRDDYGDDESYYEKYVRTHNLEEGGNNIGRQIKAVYQKIYDAGDDAVEFMYYDSPIFAQYWDEYEGDLDSIIAEIDPSELQVILDELQSAAEDQGLAEDLDRRGFLRGLGMAAAGAAGLGAAGAAQARATPDYLAKVERAKALMAKGQSREQTARIMGIKGPNPGGTGPMSGDWGAVNYAAQEMRVKEGLSEMDKSQKGAPGWNIGDDESGGKEYYGKAVKAKDVAKKAGKALDKAFDKTHSKKIKESRLNEAMLLEDPIYRECKQLSRYIAERKMTEKEILDVFQQAEAGMTDKGTGANRTFLGRGKDTAMDFAGGVKKAVSGVLDSIQNSVPVAAVDVAYDQATDALAKVAGGQSGPVMNAINKYRMLAKEYPKAAGFAKAALVAIAGFATGGAGLPAIAGLTYALDSAIKGDKLSSVIGKGAGAAALSAAGQAIHGAMKPVDTTDAMTYGDGSSYGGPDSGQMPNADSLAPGADALPSRFDDIVKNAVDYKVKPDDTLSDILANRKINPEAFKRLPGNESFFGPDGNPNILKAGQTIKLPDPADINDLNKMSWTTPSDPNLAKNFGDKDFYTGQYNQNSTSGLDAANNLKQQELGRWGSDNGMSAARAAKDAGGGMDMGGGSDFARPSAASDYGMGGNAPIDYSQPGPISTDSLGQKLEYGMPVNDKGSFIPPNPNLPAEELASQQAAYDAWKADFMRRFPNATELPDGTMQSIKPGMAPMGPTNYTPGQDTGGLTPKISVTGGGEGVISNGDVGQLMQTPAYKQAFADNMQKYGTGPFAQQNAHKAALAAAKASIVNSAKAAMVKESTAHVRIRKLPFEKLVDQKTTVLAWALSESVGRKSKSVTLSTVGTLTVFENVDRYRRAILEYVETGPGRGQLPDLYRPDAPGAPVTPTEKPGLIGRGLNWLDKTAGKVGGALSNFGHQFTTKVTKEKLKMNWHQAGKPSDSDQLAAWLVKQGVPQEVVTSVYGKMGIPYTAPAVEPAVEPAVAPAVEPTDATAQKELPWLGKDLKTKKNRTVDQMVALANPEDPAVEPAPAPAPKADVKPATGTFPGEDPKGPNYVGRREVARRQAARAGAAKPAVPNFGMNAGYAKVNQPTSITYTGMPTVKPAVKPATTANLPAGGGAGVRAAAPGGTRVVSGGPTPDEQAKLAQRIAQATKQPVAEMLSMVETKEDVAKIKQFIDQTFVKYGAVSESAFVVRNRLIEHVTQVGAQRRREFARKS